MATVQEPVRDRARAALRSGLPASLLAVAALVVGVAILVEANNRDDYRPAFAEFTVTKEACILDPQRTRGISACHTRGPGVYELVAPRSLANTTAILTRGSCCARGAAAASVTGPRSITVVLRRVRGPVRAQLLLP